jgi:hypothetical protein
MCRDFQGQDLGFEFWRFFVPVSDRSALEMAALGKSRDAADYRSNQDCNQRLGECPVGRSRGQIAEGSRRLVRSEA